MYAEEYAFDSLQQPRGSSVACPSDAPSPGTTVCYQTGNGPIVYVTTPWVASPAPADGSSPSSANSINVRVCSTVGTTFGRLVQLNAIRACKSSTADMTTTPTLPCGLCILASSVKDALWLEGGTATLNITGGSDARINSSDPEAVRLTDSHGHGGATLTVGGGGQINITGGDLTNGSSTISPAPTLGAAAIPDPLANVPTPVDRALTLPNKAAFADSTAAPQTIQPGIYPSISASGPSVLTLSPGST